MKVFKQFNGISKTPHGKKMYLKLKVIKTQSVRTNFKKLKLMIRPRIWHIIKVKA